MADDHSAPTGVAGRYASALFELADEAHDIDGVLSQLDRFTGAAAENHDLERFIVSPVFSAEDQVKTLEALLPKMGITGTTANFLRLLANNRRLFIVRDVAKGYRALAARKAGRVTAEVTVAEPLSTAQSEALSAALRAATGKDVETLTKIDPSLIGGLVVKIGSRMIDTSLKTKLSQLKIALKEVH